MEVVKGDPIYKGHGLFFKDLVYAYFGHTKTTHELFVQQETVKTRDDFKIGQAVTVTNPINNESRTGIIMKLNPTTANVQNTKDGKIFRVGYSIIQPYSGIVDKTKTDFKIGQMVKILSPRTTGSWIGMIMKLNPKNAIVGKMGTQSSFKVPYSIIEISNS